MRGELKILVDDSRNFERMAVGRAADRVLFGEHALELGAEAIGLKQIANANSTASHFIFVGRADATRRGPDFRFAARGFRGLVHLAMIRKDQVRAIAQEKAAAQFDAGFLEVFEFGDERGRIDDSAWSDHGFLLRPQDAARNQLQHVAVAVEDDRMARVVAAGVARGVIKRRGKIVDDLALPFVAPLGSDNGNRFRPSFIRQRRRSPTTRVAPCPLRLTTETLQEG